MKKIIALLMACISLILLFIMKDEDTRMKKNPGTAEKIQHEATGSSLKTNTEKKTTKQAVKLPKCDEDTCVKEERTHSEKNDLEMLKSKTPF